MRVKIAITKRVGNESITVHDKGDILIGDLLPGGDFEMEDAEDQIHAGFFRVVEKLEHEPTIIDNQPHSQGYMRKQGIGQALNLFAENESLQSAMDKAERWRNDLEEMRELGSSEEVKAINVLYDVLQTWLGQAIEISTARRVKTRKVKRGTS